MELTGAQALIKSLEMEGVEVMFGLPGGAILPVYDPIIDSSIRHILVRHEQGAGHMAEGYAQVTGRPGVAMVTSGPGATNVVTPLADAYMDSIPLVVITGQVATTAIGTDAFQESDITGITMGITKHNWLITDGADIPRVVAEAFHVATSGRPGPVLVDVPKDVAIKPMEWYWPDAADLDLPGYHPVAEGDPELVLEAARLLLAAERPIIYAGGGILKARAAESLRELAERTGIPVVTTLMARGCFPDSHPLCLGMPGMHGNYTAVTSMQRADLLVALGSRFDDRVTGKVDAFAPEAKIVHVDVDPAELNKVRRADVAIAGDCRLVIEELLAALEALGLPHSNAARSVPGGPPSSAAPGAPEAHGTVAAMFPRERLAPWRGAAGGMAGALPARLRPAARFGRPQATVRPRDTSRHDTGGHHRGGRRRPASDVRLAVVAVRLPLHVGQLRRPRNDGLRGAGVDRCQGRPAGTDGLGRRRRRVLPDDRAGAGHCELGADTGEGRHPRTIPTSGWSVSGRRCSTRSATPRSTSRPTSPTTCCGPRRWGVWASGSSRPKRWPRPSTRRTTSTTGRW